MERRPYISGRSNAYGKKIKEKHEDGQCQLPYHSENDKLFGWDYSFAESSDEFKRQGKNSFKHFL